MTTLPKYTNAKISDNYHTSLKKIGDSIIFIRSRGDLRNYNIERFNALIDSFVKEAKVQMPYVQIRDMQDLQGRIAFRALQKQRKYFLSRQSELAGYIALNEPRWMKVFIQYGIKYLEPKIKYYSTNEYADAICRAQEILEGSKNTKATATGLSVSQALDFSQIRFRPEWEYKSADSDFRYRIGAIPEKLLFVSMHNSPRFKSEVTSAILLLEKVQEENRLVNIPWIVTDITELSEGIGIHLRRSYIRDLRRLHDKFRNDCAVLLVIGASKLNIMATKVISVIFKQNIVFVDSINEAFKKINGSKESLKTKNKVQKGTYVSLEDLEEISNVCGSILWDGSSSKYAEAVSENNPLAHIAETLELIRTDLKELRENEKAQAEARLKESERHRIHLADMMNDIQKAKADLQHSEESQRILLDNIPTQVWYLTNEYTYGSVNKAHAMFLGKHAKEIAFRSMYDFLPEEIVDASRRSSREVFDNGKKTITEEWTLDAHQKYRLLSVTRTPKLRQDGSVEYVVCSAEDITERRKAENKVRQLSRAVEQSPVSIVITDIEGKIEYVNPKFINITGFSQEEALGQNPSLLKSGNQSEAFYKKLWTTITSGKTWQGELQNKKKNGETFWETASISPILDDKGKITHYLAVKEDITQRKKTEEKLRIAKEKAEKGEKRLQEMFYELQVAEEETRAANEELLATTNALKENNEALEIQKAKAKESEERLLSITENVFDGIFLLHGKKYIYVNRRLSEITECTKRELIARQNGFLKMLTPVSQQILKRKLNQHGPDETYSATLELQVASKSQDLKDIELSIVSLGLKENHPLLIGIVRDITGMKIAEEEARQKELLEKDIAIARESLVFKQNFLANMSHEIRTPLTGILGMIEILRQSELTVKQEEYLNIIRQSGESLREIVNDVLDFSKIEAGKLTLNKKGFRFSDIIQKADNLFHALCKKPITFTSNLADSMPEYIFADDIRLTQIVTNFISNAIKFTEKGKVILDTELLSRNQNSGLVNIKISVTDTGIGIKEEKFNHLFQPFSQVERTDIRHFDGTGLGLAICKELALLHGGDIGVQSVPNQGSTFWFTFQAHAISPEQIEKSNKKSSATIESRQKLNILLAEDTILNQKVISLLLNSMGHKADVVSNGKKVIEAYQPGKYDLILMDIQMPIMDGITATRILKEKFQDLPPIVGLSANAFEGDREKYMNQGLDEYVTKPIEKDQFISALERLGNQA